jgi:hypothetical protein
MRIKSLIFLVIAVFLVTSCASKNIIRKTTYSLEVKEIKGLNSYKNGDFEEAFNLLKEPAAWGYKTSQYTIAFMFLKGQYLKQSTVLGMGWLGVAKEANVKDWTEQYDKFYSVASKSERLRFDRIVELYIERYGLVAQHVTCRRAQSPSSRRVKINCNKNEGIGTLYEIDIVECK